MSDQLRYLARTYFHQDYVEESGSAVSAIESFARDETPATVDELIAEIRTLLESPASEQDIEDLWIKNWRANYNPNRDGSTYRGWFAHVVQLLQLSKSGPMEPPRVLSAVTNFAVVQMPGRKYPGLVVQGDRLREWVLLVRAGDSNSMEILAEALTASLAEYERISGEHR